jgi:hypothetical protein
MIKQKSYCYSAVAVKRKVRIERTITDADQTSFLVGLLLSVFDQLVFGCALSLVTFFEARKKVTKIYLTHESTIRFLTLVL